MTQTFYLSEIPGVNMITLVEKITDNSTIYIETYYGNYKILHRSSNGFSVSHIHYLISEQFVYTCTNWWNDNNQDMEYESLKEKCEKFYKHKLSDKSLSEFAYYGFKYDKNTNTVTSIIDH
jgi:hypothetical protein